MKVTVRLARISLVAAIVMLSGLIISPLSAHAAAPHRGIELGSAIWSSASAHAAGAGTPSAQQQSPGAMDGPVSSAGVGQHEMHSGPLTATDRRGTAAPLGPVTTREILFTNEYFSTVKIADSIVDWSCDGVDAGGPYRTVGWYYVDPGQTVDVYTSHNQWLHFYARSLDGTAVWDTDPDVGGNFWAYVNPSTDNFSNCRGIGISISDCPSCGPSYVGMRTVDVSGVNNGNFTVHLTP